MPNTCIYYWKYGLMLFGLLTLYIISYNIELGSPKTSVWYDIFNTNREPGKKRTQLYFSQDRIVDKINCLKIFSNDNQEQKKAHKLEDEHTAKWNRKISDILFSSLTNTSTCDSFKREREYITQPLTQLEEDFPLAYSILTFKYPEQVEMLLRAIYRPQNYYCIHVDIKATDAMKRDIASIAGCFDNVFISSRSIDVIWGKFTVLEPEIVCLQDLWKYRKWKYFINLTGQEFPLKTNYELVKILKAVEGANFVTADLDISKWKSRWINAGVPPHGLRPYKGSAHVTINRAFVDYVLHSAIAIDFLNWTRGIQHGDEFFFNTLNHNPQLEIPGSYQGFPENSGFKPDITRHKLWQSVGLICELWIRDICILGIEQLPHMAQSRTFFANKFYIDRISYYTLQCLDELIYNRTRDAFLEKQDFDTQYYTSLLQYKNKI